MDDTDARQPVVAPRTVDRRDPVVGPPVREHARVVEAEHVNVRPVHEVVGEYPTVAAEVARADDADVSRRVLSEAGDERFRPAGCQEVGVVVDAVEVLGVVEVRLHHGVVLGPRRLAHVTALDEVQADDDTRRTEFCLDLVQASLEQVEGGQLLEERVVLVEGQVEVVLVAGAGRTAEGRKECAEERKLVPRVLVREGFETARRDGAADGDHGGGVGARWGRPRICRGSVVGVGVKELARVAESRVVDVDVREDDWRVVVNDHVHVVPWGRRKKELEHSNDTLRPVHIL